MVVKGGRGGGAYFVRYILFFTLICAVVSSAKEMESRVDCRLYPDNTTPQAPHLAYASSISAVLSFFTCGASVDSVPIVDIPRVGRFRGSSKHLVRFHHDVVLDHLNEGETYEYSIYLSGTSGQYFNGSLRMPRKRSSPSNFTAVILGDMGVNNSDATLRLMKNRTDRYDFIHIVGDVGYADDYHLPFHIEPSSGIGYEDVYDYFLHLISPIAEQVPWMVSPGNHDVTCHVTDDLGCPEEERNFSAYNARFRMPSYECNASTQDRLHNMYYSYRVGSVHFVSVSTESDFPNAPTTPNTFVGGGAGGGFGDQIKWLEDDLKRANEDLSVSHIVVMGHRPFYASKTMDWPLRAPEHVQRAFEPLFRKYRVDLYMTAHKHYYERVAMCFEGKVDPNGTVQIINGAAGNNEGIDKGKGNGGLIVASNYESNGFCELSLETNDQSAVLRVSYVLSADGSVFDEISMPSRRAGI